MNRVTLGATLLLATAGAAQERLLAIRNARVLTMAGEPLANATVLVRRGKIEAVGPDLDVPAGAEVVDAASGTLMPGLVSAYSRAGLQAQRPAEPEMPPEVRRFRRGEGRTGPAENAVNDAAKQPALGLYARQPVFGELLRQGVTTLALTPMGGGFPGLGAVLDPAGRTLADLTRDAEAFVFVRPMAGSANKKLIKETLEKAKTALEERRKPKAEPAPAAPEATAASKPAPPADAQRDPPKSEPPKPEPPKPEPPKPEPPKSEAPKAEATKTEPPKAKPAPPKDPNIEVLADVLEGKRRVVLELTSASQVAHFAEISPGLEVPKRALVSPRWSNEEGRLDEVLELLKPWQAPILVEPALSTPAFGRQRVNPAARLVAAGYEVGFILGDTRSDLEDLRFRLMELVRHGLPAAQALAGVTLVPAKVLGLEAQVGSIEAGKTADLLLFSGDPLDPTARLVRIWHRGLPVALTADQASAAPTGGPR